MSKTEFLDPLEAEKLKKLKCVQFCRTPCSTLAPIAIVEINKQLTALRKARQIGPNPKCLRHWGPKPNRPRHLYYKLIFCSILTGGEGVRNCNLGNFCLLFYRKINFC